MSAADLAMPLRKAIVEEASIAGLLGAYQDSKPVFTRRPTPTDADYPVIVISPDISLSDNDGVNDFRPIQVRDISVYGQNDTAAHYRTVEQIAYAVREFFHSNRQAIVVSGWHVVDINATGPIPTPTDDDQTVGRMVSLTIQLARLAG